MMRRPSFRDSWVVRLRRLLRAQRMVRPRPRQLASAFFKLRCKAAKPAELFDAAELNRRLRSGRPDDADNYLERFSPFSGSRPSISYRLLLGHVSMFIVHARVASGGEEADRMASRYLKSRASYPKIPIVDYFFNNIAEMHADSTRASMIWQERKAAAADRIMDMVAKCPELQGEVRVRVRREEPRLLQAAPFRLPECPSRYPRKTTRAPTHLLVRTFLRKRLLSGQRKKYSSHSRNASSQSATTNMIMGQIASQPTILEGVSHAPVVHHKACTMTSSSKNSDFSSETNAAVNNEQGDDCTVLEKQGITSLNTI